MMGKQKRIISDNRSYTLLFEIIVGIALFMVILWNLSKLNQICVINDEFGYWGSAAYFAGENWSGLSGTSPYYGFGIGFIYMFLFKVFNDATVMYKVAIIINAVLLTSTFYLSLFCFKKIFYEIPEFYSIIFSILIFLYPNNIVQSQIAWTETLLYFWFWISFLVVLKIIEKPKFLRLVFLSIWLLYGLMIHQRTLGVLCSGILFVLLLKVTHRIDWKKLLGFMLPLCLVFAVFILVKSYLDTNFWKTLNPDMAAVNNISGQIGKLKFIFSIDGIKSFIKSICGKSFYLIISTCFIIIPFAFYSVNKMFELIKLVVHKSIKNISNTVLLNFYVLCALLSTFMISAIAMLSINTDRGDVFLYGRYTECVIGPVLLIGIGALFQCRKKWAMFGGYVGITSIIALIVNRVFNGFEFTGFNVTNCVGLSAQFSDINNINSATYNVFIQNIIIAFIVLVLITNKHAGKITYSIGCLIIFITLWGPAISYNNDITYTLQEKFSMDTKDISDVIRSTDNNYPIYYVVDDRSVESFNVDAYDRNIKYIQFYLYNKTINIGNFTTLTGEDAYYLVRKESSCFEDMKWEYTIAYENDYYAIYLKPFSKLNKSVTDYIEFYFGECVS